MWFRFPVGTDQVSIEQQLFTVEHEDKDGNKFFRAPDHFAPTVLSLGGYARVEQPEGAPEDLEVVDPKRAEATDKLAAQIVSLEEENRRLRQELGQARRERDEIRTRLDEAQAELDKQKAASSSTVKPSVEISEEKPDVGALGTRTTQNQPTRR